MSDTKISEPAPNWCRTCGRRPNDPMAALCLDTHRSTMERIHPQPAELAEQQGDAWALARELRAAMYEADGRFGMADLIRKGHIKDAECGINVLAAALAARQPVNLIEKLHDKSVFSKEALLNKVRSRQQVAWQMRTDERHNGFGDDQWREIPRDEYEAYKRVMGGNGPKMLAGTTGRGDLRIDDGGWMIEIRQLFDAPPAQGIDLGQLQRYDLDEGFDHYRGLPKDKGAHLYEDATGDWVKWDDVEALIDQRDAAPGVES